MLTASWSTLRDRWPVFVGAVVTVALGVALVQASLLALIAAVTEPIPSGLSSSEEADLRDGLAVAVMTLGMTVGISAFVAFFVVGSTFAFTVSERRRDFALLRLTGASPHQVSRLLLGEALFLGSIGTVVGVILGFPALLGEVWMLTQMKFLPDGFDAPWRPWIVLVSLTTGTGIAAIASLTASRAAAGVPALQAVRDPGATDTVMSRSRWAIGLVAFAGAIVLFAATGVTQGDPLSTSLPGLMIMIVGLAALTPLLVPLVASAVFRLLAPGLRDSPIGELSHANVRSAVGRTASTATPVIILVGLVIGFTGTVGVVNAGYRQEALSTTIGDVIVTSDEPLAEELQSVPGIRNISEEVRLDDVSIDAADSSEHYEGQGVAIDASSYQRAHTQTLVSGDLGLLGGESVALQNNFASGLGALLGDMVTVGINGSDQELRLVATFQYTLSGPRVMLPLEVLPHQQYHRQYIIQTDPGTPSNEMINRVKASLSAPDGSMSASVAPLHEWILNENEAADSVVAKFSLAVLGLVSIYIFVAIINAVVISTSARRTEFAIARLTGLTRRQVMAMALSESLTIAIVGTALGMAAAAGSVGGATIAVSTIVGTNVMVVPWELAIVVCVAAAVTVGLTTAISTLAATRQRPIAVAGSRE